MQDWLTLSENRMIWQTIRGRIIPFFWSNPIGHHVDLLLILLTRNKLSHSWSMFVNNMSHHKHLKNRYIIKLAINIDKAFSIFRTSLRQGFSLKKLSLDTILLDDFFFHTIHAIFFWRKISIIVTNDDLCYNTMYETVDVGKLFLFYK